MNMQRLAVSAVLVFVVGLSATAQEVKRFEVIVDDENGPDVARLFQLPHAEAHASKYWIGVMAAPIGDTLKAQLRIKTGLAVEQVVEDGPAAEAGVKGHDILLKLNDTELTDVKTLVEAVEASEGKKAQLVVLRGGSEKKIAVKPVERPKTENPLAHRMHKDMQSFMLKAPRNQMMLFGPGMRLRPGQDVEDLKIEVQISADGEEGDGKPTQITIKREGDKPAQITVKRDGETFEVDEESMDKLPAKVRETVKKHLKQHEHGNVWQWRRPQVRLQMPHLNPPRPPVAPGNPFSVDNKNLEKKMEAMMKQMEKLLDEVEALKKERRRAPRRRDEDGGETSA